MVSDRVFRPKSRKTNRKETAFNCRFEFDTIAPLEGNEDINTGAIYGIPKTHAALASPCIAPDFPRRSNADKGTGTALHKTAHGCLPASFDPKKTGGFTSNTPSAHPPSPIYETQLVDAANGNDDPRNIKPRLDPGSVSQGGTHGPGMYQECLLSLPLDGVQDVFWTSSEDDIYRCIGATRTRQCARTG